MPEIFDFVGDFRVPHAPGRSLAEATAEQEAFIYLFTLLGVRIHVKPGKLVRPTTSCPWLGFVIDTLRMVVAVEESKRATAAEGVAAALTMGRLPAKELAHLVGLLNFLASVVQAARPYLYSLWRPIIKSGAFKQWCQGRKKHNPLVELDGPARRDLEWWQAALAAEMVANIHYIPGPDGGTALLWEPAVLHDEGLLKALHDAGRVTHLTTDAAKTVKWGCQISAAWLPGDDNGLMAGEFPAELADDSSNFKELWTVLEVCRKRRAQLSGQLVVVRSDNRATVKFVNSGIGDSEKLTGLARLMRLEQAQWGYEVVAMHLAGKLNVVADALSRGTVLPAFDRFWHATLRRKFFSQICALVGEFDFDMMCADDGSNSLVGGELFHAPGRSAFASQFGSYRSWWFPPAPLVYATLSFLATALRKAPVKPFFAVLVPMTASFRMANLLKRFHLLKFWRVGTRLCVMKVGDEWVECPPLEKQHCVFLSRPLPDWRG